MRTDTREHCAATPGSHDAKCPDVFSLTWLHFIAVDSTQQTAEKQRSKYEMAVMWRFRQRACFPLLIVFFSKILLELLKLMRHEQLDTFTRKD